MNAATSTLDYEGLGLTNTWTECLRPGIILVTAKGKRVQLTAEACGLLGIPETSELPLEALPPPLTELAGRVLREPQSTRAQRLEFETGAAPRRKLCALASLLNSGAGGTQIVLVLEESGCLVRLEERLQRLDRLASAGTMAAGLAHEIKNALVACRTFIDLLLEKQQSAELAEVVRREMGRIDALVGRLLNYAGAPPKPALAKVHVHAVLDHSLRLVEPQMQSKRIVLQRAFHAATDLAQADEGDLEQAFVNLLLNALEAMGPDGRLTVSTALTEARGRSAAGSATTQIEVAIQDTGEGIPPENMPRLFEPFFTTKTDGTGLGLAVTHRVVRDHGGSINATSRPGQGSTFRVLLPVAGL